MSSDLAAGRPVQLDVPTHYRIDGPVQVSFSRTSITGRPLFSYRDTTTDVSLSGDDVDVLSGAGLEAVGVTLQPNDDAVEIRFTLLLPTMRIAFGEEAEFTTIGLTVVDRSQAFTLPPGPRGVLQEYSVMQLSGVASIVTS